MDEFSGQFRFNAVSSIDRSFPIKKGDACVIYVNEKPVITGFVDYVHIDFSPDTFSTIVGGRDFTSFIIDSTLSGKVTLSKPTTVDVIIRAVIKDLGGDPNINIINNTDDTLELLDGEYESSQVGQNALSYILDNALIRDLLVTTDGTGNIVLQRSSDFSISNALINDPENNNSNIRSGNFRTDNSERFNKYICVTQEDIDYRSALFENYQQFTSTFGQTIDSDIPTGRTLVFWAENTISSELAEQRSLWEANIRRAKSTYYEVEVYDFTYDGKNLWRPNILVPVIDKFCDINAELLLHDVEFIQDYENTGSTTRLRLYDRDLYQLKLNPNTEFERSRKLAKKFIGPVFPEFVGPVQQ